MAIIPEFLEAEEEAQIHRQFQGDNWRRNNQVLWSGILRDEAQRWADQHGMQTLTTAMGHLMDPSHPRCLRNQKSSKAWAKYIKGASAIFAYYISKGERVTVLSRPPPDMLHPSGQTNYQVIEEPIVKGLLGTSTPTRIEMVHPTVKGAEDTYYQIWPVDDTATWTAKFGVQKRRPWRMVKTIRDNSIKSKNIDIAKAHQEVKEDEMMMEEVNKAEGKKKGKAKKEKKKVRKKKKEEEAREKKKVRKKKKEETEKKKKKEKEKAKVEEKAKEDKKKARMAQKERKKARKMNRESRNANNIAKRLEKKERANSRVISVAIVSRESGHRR